MMMGRSFITLDNACTYIYNIINGSIVKTDLNIIVFLLHKGDPQVIGWLAARAKNLRQS